MGMGWLALIFFGLGTAALWNHHVTRWRRIAGFLCFFSGGLLGGTGLVVALIINLKGLFL